MMAVKIISLMLAAFLSLSVCLSDTIPTRSSAPLGYHDWRQMIDVETIAGSYDSTSGLGYSTKVNSQYSVDNNRHRTTPTLLIERPTIIPNDIDNGLVSVSSTVYKVIQERVQYNSKCGCNSTSQSTSYITSYSINSSSQTMSSPSGVIVTQETATKGTVPPLSISHTVASQSSLPQIQSGRSTSNGNNNGSNGAAPSTPGTQTVLTSTSTTLSSLTSKTSATQTGSTLTIANSSPPQSQAQTHSESISSKSGTTAAVTQATSSIPVSIGSSTLGVPDVTMSAIQGSSKSTNSASNAVSLSSRTVTSSNSTSTQQISVGVSSGQSLSSRSLSIASNNSSMQTVASTAVATHPSNSVSNAQPTESSDPNSQDQHSTSRPISSSVATLTQTLPSTITLSGTPSVTMVIITFVTTIFNPTTFTTATSSVPSSWASSSLVSVPSSDVPSPSKVGTETALTPVTTPAFSSIPSTSQVTGRPLTRCNGSLPQWCVYPTTSVLGLDAQPSVSTIFSFPLCACPTCIMASPLCIVSPPTQTTSCPMGWLCSLTIPYPTSTAYWSIAPGLDWQTDLSAWSINPQTLTNTKTASITSLSWTASLSTSTHDGGDQPFTLFPLRVWDCVGVLCDPNGGINWLDRVKCIFTLGCHNPFQGILGFPPPPPPVRPPIGPPELDYQTNPTTIQKNEEPSKSKSSASPCSATRVTFCTQVCSTIPVSSSLSEKCSQSCRTTATCSGSGVDITSTASCTQIITFETLLCKNMTISGESTTLCKTKITTTTGCQGSTTTSFAACSLRQPLDPNIRKTLESWAAQYPFNPADLSSLSMPRPGSTLSTPTPSITSMVSRPSASLDTSSMSAAVSMSSAASVAQESESSRLLSLASVSSWSSMVSVIDSQMSAGSVALSQQSISAPSTDDGPVPDVANPFKVHDSILERSVASVASQSSASASAAAMASASAMSINHQLDLEASVTASRIAFSLPSGIILKPTREGVLCNVDDKDLLKVADPPQNAEYQWIKLGNDRLLNVIGRFCSHIGDAVGLGSQYYVYSAVEYGHDIGTQYGANITLSVTWDTEQCVQPKGNANEKPCPTKDRSTGPWWQCAEIEDGQVSWSRPWGLSVKDSTPYDKQAHDFCVASFTRVISSCYPVDILSNGEDLWSLGGYVSTKCLRWGIFASKVSPTFFWPLMGNGTEDLRWMATNA